MFIHHPFCLSHARRNTDCINELVLIFFIALAGRLNVIRYTLLRYPVILSIRQPEVWSLVERLMSRYRKTWCGVCTFLRTT